MKTTYEAKTVAGQVRKENQDNYYLNGITKPVKDNELYAADQASGNIQIFSVCDGMGGEKSGEVASSIAVETYRDYSPEDILKNWSGYIDEANARICKQQESLNAMMGTTVALLILNGDKAFSINLGDSRIYYIHGEDIRQLTVDHNEYQMMMDAGVKADERVLRMAKSRLTQFLGYPVDEVEMDPHVVELDKLEAGDIFVLCSDGLHGVVSNEEIMEIIDRNRESHKASTALVDLALVNGSRDNITAMIIYVEDISCGTVSEVHKKTEKVRKPSENEKAPVPETPVGLIERIRRLFTGR